MRQSITLQVPVHRQHHCFAVLTLQSLSQKNKQLSDRTPRLLRTICPWAKGIVCTNDWISFNFEWSKYSCWTRPRGVILHPAIAVQICTRLFVSLETFHQSLHFQCELVLSLHVPLLYSGSLCRDKNTKLIPPKRKDSKLVERGKNVESNPRPWATVRLGPHKEKQFHSKVWPMIFKFENGLLRELNPGPLAPWARIMPLDQAATNTYRISGCLSSFSIQILTFSMFVVCFVSGWLSIAFCFFFFTVHVYRALYRDRRS